MIDLKAALIKLINDVFSVSINGLEKGLVVIYIHWNLP